MDPNEFSFYELTSIFPVYSVIRFRRVFGLAQVYGIQMVAEQFSFCEVIRYNSGSHEHRFFPG